MVERNEGKAPQAPELRVAIAREVLTVMIGGVAPTTDPLMLPERRYADKAVAFADALLEALGENQ